MSSVFNQLAVLPEGKVTRAQIQAIEVFLPSIMLETPRVWSELPRQFIAKGVSWLF